jgi:hypothetical protein
MIRVFLAAVFLAGIFGLVLADEPKADDVRTNAAAKELEMFAGIWEIAAVKPDWATKEARRLVFKKDWTYAPVDKDGKELWAGTFDLDLTATPKIWDHRSHEQGEWGRRPEHLRARRRHAQGVLRGRYVEGQGVDGEGAAEGTQAGRGEVLIDLRRVKPNGK